MWSGEIKVEVGLGGGSEWIGEARRFFSSIMVWGRGL